MSLLLDVPFHAQETPMSCWWACTRMILHYYRGRDYRYPWTLNRIFGGPQHIRSQISWNRLSSSVDSVEHYLYFEGTNSEGVAMTTEMCYEVTTQPAISCGSVYRGRYDSHAVLDPYFWYEASMPVHDRAYAIYFQATGCTSMPHRPIPGHWSYDLIEEHVRSYGPLLFIGSSTGGYTHAFLVFGRFNDEIAVFDPSIGEVSYTIERFNHRVISLGLHTHSPIYLPNSPQVLSVRRLN